MNDYLVETIESETDKTAKQLQKLARNKLDVRNIISEAKQTPSQQTFAIARVRNILYKANGGRSIIPLISEKLQIPLILTKLLRLEDIFPHAYNMYKVTFETEPRTKRRRYTEETTMELDEEVEDEDENQEIPPTDATTSVPITTCKCHDSRHMGVRFHWE